MNILQVNKYYPPVIGGVETVVKQITDGLQEQGVNVTVLACKKTVEESRETKTENGIILKSNTLFQLFRMPVSVQFFFDFWKQAKHADAIVLHHPFPLGFLAYALCGHNKPVTVFYHSDIIRQKRVGALLLPIFKHVLNKSAAIFVTSKRLAESSRLLEPHKQKWIVTPLWFEPSAITSADRKKAEHIKNTYGSPIILSIGRLVYYKGYEYLIKALEHTKGNLLIIGEGPEKTKLLAIISELGLKSRVHILPEQERLAPFYLAADVFVLSSTQSSEAFGLVQLEAMSYGCPVINTNLPTGVPEVSLHDQTGITVEPADQEELTRAVNHLLSDADLREALGNEGKKRVEQLFSKHRSIGLLKQALNDVCSQSNTSQNNS